MHWTVSAGVESSTWMSVVATMEMLVSMGTENLM
jgi:hypothetical protein